MTIMPGQYEFIAAVTLCISFLHYSGFHADR
jgi:hypothetical protein